MHIEQEELLIAAAEGRTMLDTHLGKYVVTVVEQERRSWAEMVHDNVMPYGYQAERVLRQTLEHAAAIPPPLAKRVEEALMLTSTLLAGLRDILRARYLAPHKIASLPDALRTLLLDIKQQEGLCTILDCMPFPEQDVTPHEREMLYAIAREVIQNAVKHARATTVSVKIQCEMDLLRLTVRDNGQGFSVPPLEDLLEQGHLGLFLVGVRAQNLQATVEIESKPGEGTAVVVSKKLRCKEKF